MRKVLLIIGWIVLILHWYGLINDSGHFFGNLFRYESKAFAIRLFFTYNFGPLISAVIGYANNERWLISVSLVSIVITTLRLVFG